MTGTIRSAKAALAIFATAACAKPAGHGAYVSAINSNDTDTLMAHLTDDVVYQYPGAPELVGKDAVRKWVADYFGAYTTKWEKTSIGLTVAADWAWERYTYKSTDTDRKTGQVTPDVGKASMGSARVPTGSGALRRTAGVRTWRVSPSSIQRIQGTKNTSQRGR